MWAPLVIDFRWITPFMHDSTIHSLISCTTLRFYGQFHLMQHFMFIKCIHKTFTAFHSLQSWVAFWWITFRILQNPNKGVLKAKSFLTVPGVVLMLNERTQMLCSLCLKLCSVSLFPFFFFNGFSLMYISGRTWRVQLHYASAHGHRRTCEYMFAHIHTGKKPTWHAVSLI